MDLIFCGHSHNYARTGVYNEVQKNGDNIAANVPHITSGGGGAGLYQPDLTNKGNYPHVITAWPAYEFLAFDVNGKTLTYTAYQVNNVSKDVIQPLSSTFPAADGGATLSLAPIETVVLHHFTDVSKQVSVKTTHMTYNPSTQLYRCNLELTNNGPTLTGNIHVVLDGILHLQGIGAPSNQYSTKNPKPKSIIANNPAGVNNPTDGSPLVTGLLSNITLVNATGSNNGQPMIKAKHDKLDAGDSMVVQLSFSNPDNLEFTFNPVVYLE